MLWRPEFRTIGRASHGAQIGGEEQRQNRCGKGHTQCSQRLRRWKVAATGGQPPVMPLGNGCSLVKSVRMAQAYRHSHAKDSTRRILHRVQRQ